MIDEKVLINELKARWELIKAIGRYAHYTPADVFAMVFGIIDQQPTIQPQGIDKDRLIETFTGWRDVYNDNSNGYTLMQSVIEEIQAQPTSDG